MAPRSSAKRVSYDLRPSKQCERKIMLDLFNTATASGFPIPSYRYVGMGANRFYDFILIHKYLGINKMVSIEHDQEMFLRAKFNCPYKFIEIFNTTLHNFISNDNFEGNSIYWMDYDSEISSEIKLDITSLATKIKPGDFIFLTVCGALPKSFEKENTSKRLSEFNEIFPEFANLLTKEDMEDSNFTRTVSKILHVAFTNSFITRRDGVFHLFFQVEYADGSEMVTYGGVFTTSPRYKSFENLSKIKVPFLILKLPENYRIEKFNLTEKERNLFDLATTSKCSDAKEILELKNLGFGEEELLSYKELLRYHPRYVETLV